MEISNLLKNKLDHFTVTPEPTLFGPDWSMLKLGRCPHCEAKLKYPLNRSVAFCNSKKHKSFAISIDKVTIHNSGSEHL